MTVILTVKLARLISGRAGTRAAAKSARMPWTAIGATGSLGASLARKGASSLPSAPTEQKVARVRDLNEVGASSKE